MPTLPAGSIVYHKTTVSLTQKTSEKARKVVGRAKSSLSALVEYSLDEFFAKRRIDDIVEEVEELGLSVRRASQRD